MTKERIPISGDLKSKVKQLMEYAGWQEGRKVDISIAEKYYAAHGVPMMKTTQRFYRKYFGLCCESVSYTHLDVYKRQAMEPPGQKAVVSGHRA